MGMRVVGALTMLMPWWEPQSEGEAGNLSRQANHHQSVGGLLSGNLGIM